MCDSAALHEAGFRTKTTETWLLPEDEDAFGARFLEIFPNAVWRCSQGGLPGVHQFHLHATIAGALECGRGVQAFLDLPIGCTQSDIAMADSVQQPSDPPVAALVQLLRSRMYAHEGTRGVPRGPIGRYLVRAGGGCRDARDAA